MNPLDARESNETYEYPARPYTLPMRPVQSFPTSGDTYCTCAHDQNAHRCPMHSQADYDAQQAVPVGETAWDPYKTPANAPAAQSTDFNAVEDWETDGNPFSEEAWSDKYLTAEDARVLRQDGI